MCISLFFNQCASSTNKSESQQLTSVLDDTTPITKHQNFMGSMATDSAVSQTAVKCKNIPIPSQAPTLIQQFQEVAGSPSSPVREARLRRRVALAAETDLDSQNEKVQKIIKCNKTLKKLRSADKLSKINDEKNEIWTPAKIKK